MKTSTIAAALFLSLAVVSPACASELELLQQGKEMVEEALVEARAGNWNAACVAYKSYTAFKAKHGLDQFKPVAGSPTVKQLIHKQNELTAQQNALANRNGSTLCSKAGMTWTNLSSPTTYNASSSNASTVSANIRNHCENKWGTDYRMIKYCVDQQTSAATSLGY